VRRRGLRTGRRERLPKVGEVFAAGDIDFRVFTTLVFRTDLVVDAEVLAVVDAALAANVTRWPSMTPGRLTAQVDKIVAGADADAVRRRRERQRDRQICFGPICEALVSLVHPADASPEPGYVPSKALADFVRCRNVTCRWPGCDRPAFGCDIDHTIPHSQGGPTHASNLKCYCRTDRGL